MHINEVGELLGCNRNRFYFIDIDNDTLKLGSYIFRSQERTFALHTDHQERLWVGNNRGIFEFRDSILHAPDIDHPAFRTRVEDIDELPDSSLVFGTKGLGIVRWKGKDIIQITTDDGLTADMIEDVHVDENGIIWVGTLNGLNKVTFDSENSQIVRQFTMANGLPSNEIYQIKSYEGQVWLCTAGGLVKFHEPEAETLSAAPIIQYIHVNGTPISFSGDRAFSYQQNNLEFRYLTINYRQNGQIPYRYRLNETDDWQYTQNLSVNYPQLPPGDYRFEVQSQNQDGYWSAGTNYAFSIQPPWWNTWWARGIAGLLVLVGIVYFQRQAVAKVKKEAAIQRQIDELERSALQAQMNPHFIFNCLNSIQNFILQNDRKRAVEYLSRFAQLVRHNLNASVQGKVSLEEELGLLDNYLALEQERFEHRFDYTLEVEEGLNQQFIAFPPLLIQPYVENAIIHGLSKKEEKGKVEVHFTIENGQLAVTIRDNGPGYQPDQKKKHSGKHKSVGMTITQKRLEILGESPEKVVQISNLNGEEGISGTEVKIFIDLNQTT
jgi:signal transduction histidine kinase